MQEITFNYDLCEYNAEFCDVCDQKCIILHDLINCDGDDNETKV